MTSLRTRPDAPPRQGWAAVEHSILRDPNLSSGAKVVYAILRGHNGRMGCFPAQKTVAEEMAVSTRTVQRYLKELMDAGHVHVRRLGQGRTNRYTLSGSRTQTVEMSRSARKNGRVHASRLSDLDATATSHPRKKTKGKKRRTTTRADEIGGATPSATQLADTEVSEGSVRGMDERVSSLLAVFNATEGTSFDSAVVRTLIAARVHEHRHRSDEDLARAVRTGLSQDWLRPEKAVPGAVFRPKQFEAALNSDPGGRFEGRKRRYAVD